MIFQWTVLFAMTVVYKEDINKLKSKQKQPYSK